MIGVIIIVNLPKFLSLEASISVLLALMFISFLVLYKPRKPSPMEVAGRDWTAGQLQAIREEQRRKQEQKRWQKVNRFFRR